MRTAGVAVNSLHFLGIKVKILLGLAIDMKNQKVTRSLRTVGVVMAAATCLVTARAEVPNQTAAVALQPANSIEGPREMTLDECLVGAMQNNRRRRASKFAVTMAEAQHRQALAAYWPQITGNVGYQRVDESPYFLFPASTMSLPAIPLPVGAIPAMSFNIPAQDVKLMDPDSVMTSLNTTWLLYDGGMRKGYREQANGLVAMMKEDARRTDLEIADSVKRIYYGSVLARQLHQVGLDTLARMEATLNLTETMYKEGSGKVKKTDFLDNKVMVETLRAMVALLEKNEEMAQAALANTMGLAWNTAIRPKDAELPYTPFAENLDNLVNSAYQFSPDWAKVEAGIRAAEGSVRTAKSGHYPKLAVTGELHKWWNDYDAGLATDRNKEGWTVGVGVEIPIFSGFLTKNKVAETCARVDKIREEQFLLKEGIGLQIKDVFLGLRAAQKSYRATLDAMTAAQENRDLNTRAYQNELVETEKVIRAQLMEALMSAQHYKTCYDHIALQSQMTLLVGTEVLKKLRL